MNLSAAQNKVIYALQNGFSLITSNTQKGAAVGSKEGHFMINNRVFWNLVDKKLIYQSHNRDHHFNYILTDAGSKIKTKPVKLILI